MFKHSTGVKVCEVDGYERLYAKIASESDLRKLNEVIVTIVPVARGRG